MALLKVEYGIREHEQLLLERARREQRAGRQRPQSQFSE
jgi:hypothetical protein